MRLWHRTRLLFSGLAIIAGLVVAGPLVPSAASAADTASGNSTSISSAPASTTVHAAAAGAITCQISVENPHRSSHVANMVNVIARVRCTAPVSIIAMSLGLDRNGHLVGQRTNSNQGQSSLKSNVAVRCVTGNYVAAAAAFIVFPPRFVPPSGTIAATSNAVHVRC